MPLISHYRQLASYDVWANREVAEALRASGNPPPQSLKWLAHIVAAEYVWLTRLRSETAPLPVWPELSLERCEEESKKLGAAWRDFLASDARLEQSVSYKNSKGESWTNSVADILTHVFLHSAYHRGQIAADMRQAGYTPAYTDFIHGVRQGLVE
jgi:uncharacterized damage-inducible protein DinB